MMAAGADLAWKCIHGGPLLGKTLLKPAVQLLVVVTNVKSHYINSKGLFRE